MNPKKFVVRSGEFWTRALATRAHPVPPHPAPRGWKELCPEGRGCGRAVSGGELVESVGQKSPLFPGRGSCWGQNEGVAGASHECQRLSSVLFVMLFLK